ncbi:MAG: M20/M25/M40 family metallo-hydrolase [Woeseiaceae bacterium]|nr:M20/M25/M40 family metallo-hydrolase [Woeseiaceae bacterium]
MLDTLPQYTYYNALARTTCIPTEIEGGHAENALPQTATVVINCRVVPQTPVEEVMQTLGDLAKPYDISIEQVAEAFPSPPSPLTPSIVEPIRDVATERGPASQAVPEMSTGATDGLFMRNVGIPVYAVSAIAEDPNENRIHGKDERIRVESFNDSLQYWYRLVKRLSGG